MSVPPDTGASPPVILRRLTRSQFEDYWGTVRGYVPTMMACGWPSAIIRCPRCDVYGQLVHHQIRADGLVVPDLHCFACDWQGAIQLDGWRLDA